VLVLVALRSGEEAKAGKAKDVRKQQERKAR
jgi:hypothetical protein